LVLAMNIGGHISWHVELAIEPQNMLPFRQLTAEMVDMTCTERGVLIYERFVSEDERTVHVIERYRDSAAAEVHLHAFAAHFAKRFGMLVQRKSFRVFGEPSEPLRALLTKFGATFAKPLHGFTTFYADANG
jgi:quinol monooxygenase YgiN